MVKLCCMQTHFKDFLLRVNIQDFMSSAETVLKKTRTKFFPSSAGENQAVQPHPPGMSKPPTHEEHLAISATPSPQNINCQPETA